MVDGALVWFFGSSPNVVGILTSGNGQERGKLASLLPLEARLLATNYYYS